MDNGAARVALLIWIVGWLTKGGSFIGTFLGPRLDSPLVVEGMFSAGWIPLVSYPLPVLVAAVAVALGGTRWVAGAALLGASASGVLLVHTSTFSDATFVTAFWSALWIGWVSTATAEEAARWGARLAQGVVSLVFLGAALGKFTPAYVDGSAFYELYLATPANPIYVWLHEILTPDVYREAATWISMSGVAVETALATCVLWPRRIGLMAGIVGALGIVILTTPSVFAATGPVVAVCIGGLLTVRNESSDKAEGNVAPSSLPDLAALVGAEPEQREVVARRVPGAEGAAHIGQLLHGPPVVGAAREHPEAARLPARVHVER